MHHPRTALDMDDTVGAPLAPGESWHNQGPEEGQQLNFQACVTRIREVLDKTSKAFDGLVKADVLVRTMRAYFEFEEPKDVFEGFLHLVIYLQQQHSTPLGTQYDMNPVKLALVAFDEHHKAKEAKSREANAEQGDGTKSAKEGGTDDKDMQLLNLPSDPKLVPKALDILSNLKPKYLDAIADVFQLRTKRMQAEAVKVIRALLDQKEDLPKAITWMSQLNLRDQFGFQQIVCTLILDDQTALLYPFIGEDQYRRRQFIRYLNDLLGDKLKRRPVTDDLERRLIESPKLAKVTTKFVKHFNFPDSEVPNLMKHRTQAALMHQHWQWQHGGISSHQFEEIAVHALTGCPEVRDYYFRRLCSEWRLADRAYRFALMMNLPEAQWIPELRHFVQEYPEEVQRVHDEHKSNAAIRLRNQELEEEEGSCEVAPGIPIHMIETWAGLEPLIEHLRSGAEEYVGIDAEWRPHFTSTTEQISIIQIATQNAVFLVDALLLEQREHISDDQWLNFFDALLCTKHMRKIGYDFRNDMRVFRSTYPCIEQLLTQMNSVICMYRLLSQVKLMPDVSAALFDRPDVPAPKNLSLADVSEYFLRQKLEKIERVGNWSHRPLRLAQKQYAAQDAHCLRQIFCIVARKIKSLPDPKVGDALRQCAQIKYSEKDLAGSAAATAPNPEQMVRIRGAGKEAEQDFITNVLTGAAELAEKAGPELDTFMSSGDVRFVADSMLFGLGKNLRKCGFHTELMANRDAIVEFCRREGNENFIVLSTGKGHKQLELALPGRAVFVPITTDGTTPPSMLVLHVLNELRVHLRPEDMLVRCVECNERAFVRLPKRVVQTLFYMNVVRHGADWLEISKEDLQQCFELLRMESMRTFPLSDTDDDEDESEQRQQYVAEQKPRLDDEEYFLFESVEHEVAECRTCAVDLMNGLVLAASRGSPVQIRVGLRFKKDTFDQPGLQFFVCAKCGKVQLNSAGSE